MDLIESSFIGKRRACKLRERCPGKCGAFGCHDGFHRQGACYGAHRIAHSIFILYFYWQDLAGADQICKLELHNTQFTMIPHR